MLSRYGTGPNSYAPFILCVVYYSNELKYFHIKSFAFFSDDLHQDTTFVYQLQKLLSQFLHERFNHLTMIQYFSDGCASQYKIINFLEFNISS